MSEDISPEETAAETTVINTPQVTITARNAHTRTPDELDATVLVASLEAIDYHFQQQYGMSFEGEAGQANLNTLHYILQHDTNLNDADYVGLYDDYQMDGDDVSCTTLFDEGTQYDDVANIDAALEMTMLARARFGSQDIHFTFASDISREQQDIMHYAAHLTGLDSPNARPLEELSLSDDVKAQMEARWAEMQAREQAFSAGAFTPATEAGTDTPVIEPDGAERVTPEEETPDTALEQSDLEQNIEAASNALQGLQDGVESAINNYEHFEHLEHFALQAIQAVVDIQADISNADNAAPDRTYIDNNPLFENRDALPAQQQAVLNCVLHCAGLDDPQLPENRIEVIRALPGEIATYIEDHYDMAINNPDAFQHAVEQMTADLATNEGTASASAPNNTDEPETEPGGYIPGGPNPAMI